MRLLLLLCTIGSSTPFAFFNNNNNNLNAKPTKLFQRVPKRNSASGDSTGGVDVNESVNRKGEGGSDLKALLPTPSKQTLQLDKFGRRIHDFSTDGVARYAKGKEKPSSSSASTGSTDGSIKGGAVSGSAAPAGGVDGGDGEGGSATRPKSDKEYAADASSADFSQAVKYSSDLKALLPTQKMRFMKLDKFGRRVQRMEDDGTVNVMKEPADVGLGSEIHDSKNSAATASDVVAATNNNDNDYGSLKDLLAPASDVVAAPNSNDNNYGSLKDLLAPASGVVAATKNNDNNYGSLKDLLPTKRPTWTKLDFHGASVPDERRTKTTSGDQVVGDSNDDNAAVINEGSNLKDLLPKKAIWTKLDFHGASVEDERRTKKKVGTVGGSFNVGQYSNLTTLLPKRTISWKKDQVLSSGSAPVVSDNVRGLREERQQAMKNEVIASVNEDDNAALSSDDEDDDDANWSEEEVKPYSNLKDVLLNNDADSGEDEELKPYSNLKDLLPERKFSWRSSPK